MHNAPFLFSKNWEINIEMQQKQVSDLSLSVYILIAVINPPPNKAPSPSPNLYIIPQNRPLEIYTTCSPKKYYNNRNT